MANPIVLIVAAIVAAAAAIYIYWEPIRHSLLTLECHHGLFQNAYNKFVEVTGFDPLGYLASKWGGVKAFFSEIWNALPQIASTAWEGIKTVLQWSPAGLILGNWGNIKSIFFDIWNALPNIASTAWEAIKAVIAWHPAALIYNNWGTIKDALGNPIEARMLL